MGGLKKGGLFEKGAKNSLFELCKASSEKSVNFVSIISKSKNILFTSLENERKKAINWFRMNNMIVNPAKF